MHFTHLIQLDKRKRGDVLLLPYWKGKKGSIPAFHLKKKWPSLLDQILHSEDFKGKEGEVLLFYVDGEIEQRFCLVGLGDKEKVSREALRRSYGTATKLILSKRLKNINLVVPQVEGIEETVLVQSIAEGLLLPNYVFHRYKNRDPKEAEEPLLQSIGWIGLSKGAFEIVSSTFKVCQAVNFARDLINGNADEVTPQYLAECAKEIAKKHPAVRTTIFDKKRLEKEKMALLLAVNRGASQDPVMIIMEYRGNPKSKDTTVFVGKGVTYDTGGLNLKPTGGMETMKCDMSGGAICMATILAVSELKLKVNLTVVIPSTENGIDAKSFKPGDVYSSYLGKTVEMTNSDAEGRLILADALSYAVKHLHPTRLIDMATLTGAMEISLGSEAAGLMATDDALAEKLLIAGEKTFERMWRMPLYEEYKERLKSDIADLKSWNGRSASSCVAATFLRSFVDEKIPWAHIDIAGTAFVAEAKKYLPKYATGYGVRLMVEFLRSLSEKA